MNTHVLLAVFRRNFVSYFGNPTGYVFICVFVLLGALAAFWPPDFFNNNLANLDQLNYWFPFIMLIFIPTITMGIWADERKQGTDELLLTIPAGDFDIVLGKYLAALAIYSVSLLFSMFCNFAVLRWLGNPDAGLFFGTYVGYWLIGAAMLAVGMVASFLTSNLTIGFILGVLLNMPLVFFMASDVLSGILGRDFVQLIRQWSIGQQFDDFGHGVLSLAGLMYFLMILAVMLYVSMALIGRRHWFSGLHRWRHAGHYAIRALALVVIAGGIVAFFQNHDIRCDVTSERLSSLSPKTRDLVHDLNTKRPVQIDAFVSPNVPESYVQTRLNLLTVLRELGAMGGSKIQVRIHNTERFSDEAALAQKRFGIEPHEVRTLKHNTVASDYIFLDVAVQCGLEKVAPVFFDKGLPTEYELVRSVCTVTDQKRKRVGVLKTDAEMFGGFNMQMMSATPAWPFIEELQKQYEVVKVDPAKPITEKYDVLLAVQPSSLGIPEMDNFVAAVRSGQPTAIFEDPAPVLGSGVPGTSQPRRAAGGNPMFGGMQPPPSKGDIGKLWALLGVDFVGDQIIWQDYNPYPKANQFPKEFVFIDRFCGAKKPFNDRDPISSGLQHILFPFPGAVTKLHASPLQFTPLVETSDQTGTVAYRDMMQMDPFGRGSGLNPQRRQRRTAETYVLAAHIEGNVPAAASSETEKQEGAKGVDSMKSEKGENSVKSEKDENGEKGEKEAEKPRENKISVVLVADVDMLSQDFFHIRQQGNLPELGMNFDFDNVTFVLNVLDSLASDPRFVDIRKRRPEHRTLSRIEDRTKDAKDKAMAARDDFVKKFADAENEENDQIAKKIADLKKRKNVDSQQMLIELALMQQELEQAKTVKIEHLRQEKDGELNKIETDLTREVGSVQDQYKLWAVLLPPIPPLVVAIVVYFSRRKREREGVSRSRLR